MVVAETGFAHVSCLAEQAKILCAEAEENNLDLKVKNERFSGGTRVACVNNVSPGVVRCALSWACWSAWGGRRRTSFGALRWQCLGTVAVQIVPRRVVRARAELASGAWRTRKRNA